jgi:hypothetical protein
MFKNWKGSSIFLFLYLTEITALQYTIEEKVIERAYKKLALDALVIQQGRLAEQKGLFFFPSHCMYNNKNNNQCLFSLLTACNVNKKIMFNWNKY